MSTQTRNAHAHNGGSGPVTDGELIRYLDGELSDEARASLEARLRSAPEAARRLRTLQRRSDGFATLLADVDPGDATMRERADALRQAFYEAARAAESPSAAQPPSAAELAARRWGTAQTDARGEVGPAATERIAVRRVPARRAAWFPRPGMVRAAAIIALLLIGAFAVPPARAWVVDRVRDVAAALGLATPTPATVPAEALPAAGADVTVTFAVTGDVFEIQLARPAGTLLVLRGTAATGSAEAEGDAAAAQAPDIGFAVMPAGLRIVGASPGATYRVTLPPTVGTVHVRVGAETVTAHPLPPDGEALRIRY